MPASDPYGEANGWDRGGNMEKESLGARPVMARRMSKVAARGPGSTKSSKDQAPEMLGWMKVQEDPSKLAEEYILSSVQAGDWMKASQVRQIVERRGGEREICRAAAKAAESIAANPRGLDAVVEQGTLQCLAQEWGMHSADTLLAVHMQNLVARFWERAAKDGDWVMAPTTLATGREILANDRVEWVDEAHKAAVALHSEGSLRPALELYKVVVFRMSSLLGASDQSTLQAQNNMAVLLEERGLFEEALALSSEVAAKLETVLGDDHSITLSCNFNRAALKAKMGRLTDAEELYKQVVAARQRTLGAQHASTLRARGNLAELLRRQGKLPEAETMLLDIVEKRHAAFGREDRDTLASRCALARVLALQGDSAQLRQAEAHFREVITRRQQSLGRGHPDTLAVVSRLACLLEEKRPDEAEQMHEQVWTALDTAAPPERRRTQSRQGKFVSNLEETGEPERAEAMLRQVVERRRATLGAAHPDTLAVRAELAALLTRRTAERSPAEALEMWRELRELCESSLGLEHVDTLAARTSFAGALLRQAAKEGTTTSALGLRSEADSLLAETISRYVSVAPAWAQETTNAKVDVIVQD